MYIIIRDNFERDDDHYVQEIEEGQPIRFENGAVTFTAIDGTEFEVSVEDIIEIGE